MEEHKKFLHELNNKYENPMIQKQRLFPGSIYLNWYLNERNENKDDQSN